ncbi:MAG: phage tail sheath subtilisin-like domain-containing protein [Bacteroidetes bacterium]|nr:phage tail sheath subtilisin-like domain-containing protein [Bacteroidota bacterium]
MATSYKTPGVYVEEIPKFPPSIAAVETAIPAFVGYTLIAEKRGASLIGVPTKISSLLEYTSYFGEGLAPESIQLVTGDASNNYAVQSINIDGGNRFYLYDSVRLFYDNGGGDCYIVSVGLCDAGTGVAIGEQDGDPMGMLTGLTLLEKVDEPTILLFPDAVSMSDASFYSLQQAALMQCAKLQDRVAVFDLQENKADDLPDAVDNFRNSIGINSLKYGMAYGPWIFSSYPREVDYSVLKDNVYKGSVLPANKLDLKALTTDADTNALVTTLESVLVDVVTVQSRIDAISAPDASMQDRLRSLTDAVNQSANDTNAKTNLIALIDFIRDAAIDTYASWSALSTFRSSQLFNDAAAYGKSPALWKGGVTSLLSIELNNDVNALTSNTDVVVLGFYSSLGASSWAGDLTTVVAGATVYSAGAATELTQCKLVAIDVATAFNKIANYVNTIKNAALAYKDTAQDALYEKHPYISNWVAAIQQELGKLPPSGAVAGIYARVDEARGVWKAPANESLNSVTGPAYFVSADEQAGMNVDPIAGKSINIIRSFIGKGTLIWGARTLAGNDNEWRYVNVRRFFNMVEESSKNATEQFVFEPNDANTWVKVQGMIENFLTTLWRQGALQGAKPEHAFYVAVGLGKTMTALDILEGRMIVEIGMAVVRPAEFIILRFSHKMAES